jgi:hypothetical protein
MAGQIPLETRYYPSDFQVLTINVQGLSTTAGNNPANFVLLSCDRDIIVDSAVFWSTTHTTTASKGMKLKSVEPATGSSAYVTAVPAYGTSTTDVSSAITISNTSGDYPRNYEFSINKDNNYLRRGSRLFLSFSGSDAGAWPVGNHFSVTVRFRSQS